MAEHHKISNVDEALLTGDCSVCGPGVRVKKSHNKKRWETKVWYRCHLKYLVTKTSIERPWDFHRKDHCEQCGFIPEHMCQLTVDHIDGNRYNNETSNYQTLCHNCHALKTYRNKDNLTRYSSAI